MTNAAAKMPNYPVSYQPKPDSVEWNYQTQVTSRSRERGVILTLHGWNKLPDGRILATSSQDRTTKLWDVQTGECFQTLRGDCLISSENW